MILRVLILLYGLSTLAVAFSSPLLLRDAGRWGMHPLMGVFSVGHAVLAIILSMRAGRQWAVQWLGVTFALLAFGCSVWVADVGLLREVGLHSNLFLAHIAVGAGTLVLFSRAFGTLDDEGGAERGSGGWSWLDWSPVALGVVVGGIYLAVAAAPYQPGNLHEVSVFAWVAACMVFAARHLWINKGIGPGEARLRMRWMLLATAFWALAGSLYFVLSFCVEMGLRLPWDWYYWVWVRAEDGAALLAVVGSSLLVYGMLTQGTIDPSFAIRRTTVFGSLGIVFLFLLAGFGNLAESWLEGGLGLPGGVGTVLTGGTIAVVLTPVKRHMDRWMNRILPATVLAEAPTQTVAILFSDITGYIRLTGEDQKTALTLVTLFHKTADRNARQYSGRVVKTNADEVMLEFKDPIHAVRAALELQDEFHEAARRLDLPTPEICTGIHFGEVTRSNEGDLFGDAVNVASKIQGLAQAGQVVLSSAAKQRLGEGEFSMEALGRQELKNVAEPVECFRLRAPHG